MRQLGQQNAHPEFLLGTPIFVQKIIGHRKNPFDISFNVEVSSNVSLRKSQFAGIRKYTAYCTRPRDLPGGSPKLSRLRFPAGAIPKLNRKISRKKVAENFLQESQGAICILIFLWNVLENSRGHGQELSNAKLDNSWPWPRKFSST